MFHRHLMSDPECESHFHVEVPRDRGWRGERAPGRAQRKGPAFANARRTGRGACPPELQRRRVERARLGCSPRQDPRERPPTKRLFSDWGCVSLVCLLLFLGLAALPAQAEQVWDDELNRYLTPEEMGFEEVYLTPEDAAKLMFPESERIEHAVLTLSPEQKQTVEERIGWSFPETYFECFIGKTDGKIEGWALVQNTIGKHKPMTYMVGVDPDGEVINVEVLVYRESRGSEVRTARFNYQYEGKTVFDPIRINRDIINISGATMSVRSMSAGVKRVLVVVDEVYLKPQGRGSNLPTARKKEKGFFETLFGL